MLAFVQGYHEYINTALPPESPHLYGLHPNAEIGFLTATSEKMFKVTILRVLTKSQTSRLCLTVSARAAQEII